MSLSQIIDKYYALLLVPLTGIVTFFFARKKEKISLNKSQSELDQSEQTTKEKVFDFKVRSDNYYEERIATLQAKLDAISAKLVAMTEQSEKWERLHSEVVIQVDEMKAQLTIWKTITK